MFYEKKFLKMDKAERLFDAMNNPEKYSSVEIEEMLQDPEVKGIFDLLDKAKSSLQPIPTPNIEDEWIRFKNKNMNKRKSTRLKFTASFPRAIAASVTATIISITAVAAIVGISVNYLNHKENDVSENELRAAKDNILNQQDSVKLQTSDSTPSFDSVIFDNEPLEVIMKQISDFYGYKSVFKNNSIKSLRLYFRWNRASTIQEIVESLNNFEQIHLTIKGKNIEID